MKHEANHFKIRLVLSRVLVGLSAVCCVGIGFGIASGSSGQKNEGEAKLLAAYKRSGMPWEAKDLVANPPVKDAENAAALIREAGTAMDHAKITFEDLEKVREDIDLGDGVAALRIMRPYRQALSLASAASMKSKLDWKADLDLGIAADDFPRLSKVKALVKTLSLRAEAEAVSGHAANCCSDLLSAARLANLGPGSRNMIGMLVQIAECAIYLSSLEQCAISLMSNEGALGKIEKAIQTQPVSSEFLSAIRGEAYFEVATARNMAYISKKFGPRRQHVKQGDLLRSGFPKDLMNGLAMHQILRYYIKASEILKSCPDDPVRASAKIDSSSEAKAREFVELKSAAEALMTEKATENVERAFVESLRYRLRNGRFPRSVRQIPHGPWIDPFTKKPLHVISSGDKFRVYSVGRTGKDHGGKSRREVASSKEGYDIVAAYPRVIFKHQTKHFPPFK